MILSIQQPRGFFKLYQTELGIDEVLEQLQKENGLLFLQAAPVPSSREIYDFKIYPDKIEVELNLYTEKELWYSKAWPIDNVDPDEVKEAIAECQRRWNDWQNRPKKTYRVYYKICDSMEIEARNEEEAKEIANDSDLAFEHPDFEVDWISEVISRTK